MRRLLMILPLMFIASGASADIARYDLTKMTCSQVHAALQTEGTALLRWPSSAVPGMTRFGKYVSRDYACPTSPTSQTHDLTSVKASDGSCGVMICHDINVLRDHLKF